MMNCGACVRHESAEEDEGKKAKGCAPLMTPEGREHGRKVSWLSWLAASHLSPSIWADRFCGLAFKFPACLPAFSHAGSHAFASLSCMIPVVCL